LEDSEGYDEGVVGVGYDEFENEAAESEVEFGEIKEDTKVCWMSERRREARFWFFVNLDWIISTSAQNG
jgi:hypothetical protein